MVELVVTCDGCREKLDKDYVAMFITLAGKCKLLTGNGTVKHIHACSAKCLNVVLNVLENDVSFLSKEERHSIEEYGVNRTMAENEELSRLMANSKCEEDWREFAERLLKDRNGLVTYIYNLRLANIAASEKAPNEEAKMRCLHTANVLCTVLQKIHDRTEW